MSEKQKIKGKPGPFTSIPLLYDDADLTVYENRLLTHYARVGSCWEGVRTTATRCRMSLTSVIKARNGLAEKGWIIVGENDKGTIQVEVVDVWALDATIYGGTIKRPHEWVARFGSVPNLEQALFQMSNATDPNMESERSINGNKEDLIKKTTEEEGKEEKVKFVKNVNTEWERSVEPITAAKAEMLGLMVEECEEHRLKLPDGAKGNKVTGEEWIISAIKTANKSATGKFNIKYVQAIVDRWIRDGFDSPFARDKSEDYKTGVGEGFWND